MICSSFVSFWIKNVCQVHKCEHKLLYIKIRKLGDGQMDGLCFYVFAFGKKPFFLFGPTYSMCCPSQ